MYVQTLCNVYLLKIRESIVTNVFEITVQGEEVNKWNRIQIISYFFQD